MIEEAVVLMAGTGSRLRQQTNSAVKPLTPLLGRPLVSYVLETLARARLKLVHAVVGFEKETLMAQLPALAPPGMRLQFIENPDYEKQNGVSVLAATRHVQAPFLLTMADHLFDSSIVDLLIENSGHDQLNLAIDRKLDAIVDLADAMKVQTQGDRIVAIGKNLSSYDAIDTGLFICPQEIFEYLERAKHNGDCSLADGVRAMARDGKVRATDIGRAWWQDIDTPEMLAAAEKKLCLSGGGNKSGG